MAQLQIKQISGLAAALAAAVTAGSNLGSGNVTLFDSKSSQTLQFDSLSFDSTFVTPTKTSGAWAISVNVGTTANKIVQLNGSAQLPAVDGSLLIDLNATNIGSGTLSLSRLALANGYLYQGNGSGNPAAVAPSSIALSSFGAPTTNISLGAYTFTTSLTSFSSGMLVTYDYVNSVAQGLAAKDECACATTANITLSGLQTIDGYTTLSGDRVLVKNQSTAANNGIYVAASGSWTRAVDAAAWVDIPGAFVFVLNGTTNANTGWVFNVPMSGTLGTTSITAVQFSAAGTYTNGSGLALSGTVFSVKVDGTTTYIDGSSNVAVKSSGTQYQVLQSAGSGSATWGALNLAQSAAVTGTLGFGNGGTGFATLAQHTLVGAITAANGLDNLAVGTNTLVGRVSGNISALSASSVLGMLNIRWQMDTGTLTAGSMVLGTLSQTPATSAGIMIFINGLLLKQTTDYTISGTTVTATSGLNVAYGGSASDGNGFASSDVFQAVYLY